MKRLLFFVILVAKYNISMSNDTSLQEYKEFIRYETPRAIAWSDIAVGSFLGTMLLQDRYADIPVLKNLIGVAGACVVIPSTFVAMSHAMSAAVCTVIFAREAIESKIRKTFDR